MNLFVDTSALIAMANRKDQCHTSAKRFLETLDSKTEFHTSNYIIDETITRIRMIAGHKYAVTFGQNIFNSDAYRIHYIDLDLEKKAFHLFKKYKDKELSFTDCTSFALMKEHAIKKAFAFDTDFVSVGFETLPSET